MVGPTHLIIKPLTAVMNFINNATRNSFIQYLVATIELVRSPVCVSLSEIAQIPKASLLLDQWDFDFPDN